jgi:type IV pilus assembly protein PilA
LALFAGCTKAPVAVVSKPASVPLVPVEERSRHFEAVNSHLELGGMLYGYVDIDNDALAMAATAQNLALQLGAAQPQAAAFAKLDYKGLFTEMGLTDIKALGFSSVRDTKGLFRNRAFLYTPEGRRGLLAIFGGQPGRFLGARLAPPDTDFYTESEFDLTAVYDTVKAIVAKVGGAVAVASLEKGLKDSGAASGFSALDLIEGLNGRGILIVRLDPRKTVTLPGPQPMTIPAFDGLVRIDGVGAALEGALIKSPDLVAASEGDLHSYSPRAPSPVRGFQYILAVHGKALYAATSAAFLRECIGRSTGLDSNTEFAAGLAALGPDGNAVSWVSAKFFSRLRDLPEMNQGANPSAKRLFGLYATSLSGVSQSLFSVRTNLPDGILFRSNWNRSLKGDLALLTIYNPVTVGLIAAMAIPAYQRVQQASQEKAVQNNLRSLSAAADQYYLINGVAAASYDLLVGPDKLVKALVPVAGENYRSVVFIKGVPLRVRLPDGRMILESGSPYGPMKAPAASLPEGRAASGISTGSPLGQPAQLPAEGGQKYRLTPVPTPTAAPLGSVPTMDRADGLPVAVPAVPGDGNPPSIEGNLRKLDEAANRFYAQHGTTTTTYEQLVGPHKYVAQIIPVQGEEYRSLLFKQGRPLRLYLKDGTVYIYPPQ